jgi:nucleoid-associated protein YgaU
MSQEPIADPDETHGTQILWGRVLVLLLALALAFWLGTTFGGDNGAQRQLTEQRDEITRLGAQIASLQAELAAVDAGGDETVAPSGDAASEVAAAQTSRRETPSEEPENKRRERPEGRSYVIQSGDSLAAIAQEVYGDPTKWRDIARANDLREPYALTVGESLQVPEVP